jgi:hypothetical protein
MLKELLFTREQSVKNITGRKPNFLMAMFRLTGFHSSSCLISLYNIANDINPASNLIKGGLQEDIFSFKSN